MNGKGFLIALIVLCGAGIVCGVCGIIFGASAGSFICSVVSLATAATGAGLGIALLCRNR